MLLMVTNMDIEHDRRILANYANTTEIIPDLFGCAKELGITSIRKGPANNSTTHALEGPNPLVRRGLLISEMHRDFKNLISPTHKKHIQLDPRDRTLSPSSGRNIQALEKSFNASSSRVIVQELAIIPGASTMLNFPTATELRIP